MQIYKKITPLTTLLLLVLLSTMAFLQPGIAVADAPASGFLPQATPQPLTEDNTSSSPPLSLTLSLLCFCVVFAMLIGVFVLGVIVRVPGSNEVEKAKEEHGL